MILTSCSHCEDQTDNLHKALSTVPSVKQTPQILCLFFLFVKLKVRREHGGREWGKGLEQHNGMGGNILFLSLSLCHVLSFLYLSTLKTIFKPRAKPSSQGPSSSQQLESQISQPSHSTQNANIKLGSPPHRFKMDELYLYTVCSCFRRDCCS